MVCEHIARQKTFPQRQDFCYSIWCQQLWKSLKHVDGFHIGVFLRSEIASRIHEHLYTCYNMPCRIWAALHSWALLCMSVFGFGIQPYLVCSQGRAFLLLGLWNSIPPKLNVWWLVEGAVDALDFSLFASHTCAFSVDYSFLFLKKTFHLNLGHTWEVDINECNLNVMIPRMATTYSYTFKVTFRSLSSTCWRWSNFLTPSLQRPFCCRSANSRNPCNECSLACVSSAILNLHKNPWSTGSKSSSPSVVQSMEL